MPFVEGASGIWCDLYICGRDQCQSVWVCTFVGGASIIWCDLYICGKDQCQSVWFVHLWEGPEPFGVVCIFVGGTSANQCEFVHLCECHLLWVCIFVGGANNMVCLLIKSKCKCRDEVMVPETACTATRRKPFTSPFSLTIATRWTRGTGYSRLLRYTNALQWKREREQKRRSVRREENECRARTEPISFKVGTQPHHHSTWQHANIWHWHAQKSNQTGSCSDEMNKQTKRRLLDS